MAQEDRPVGTGLPRFEDFKRRGLPVLVWGTLAAIVVVMLVYRARHYQFIGLAQSLDYQLSPTVTGTVESVLVALHDNVEAGDVVAKLDDRGVLASIQTAQASIRQLQAELEAEETRMVTDGGQIVADLRRFQVDEEARRLEGMSLKVELAGDQIELQRRALDVKRLEPLLAEGLISQADFDNARLLHDELRSRINEQRILLAQTDTEFLSAKARREEYERRLPAGLSEKLLLSPLREAVNVQSQRLREIEVLREGLVLRSPVSGQVSRILCGKGQTVMASTPILTIAERSVREIVTYLRDGESVARQSQTVVVAKRANPGVSAESVVLSVGVAVQEIPQRIWRDPRVPEYGRAVVIAPAPALALSPGEMVDVKFVGD